MKKKFMALSMLMLASSSYYVMLGSGPKPPTGAGAKGQPKGQAGGTSKPAKKPAEAQAQAQQKFTDNPTTAEGGAGKPARSISSLDMGAPVENLLSSLPFDAAKPSAGARRTTLQRFNQELHRIPSSTYKNIKSLGKPQGRQEFVKNVSEMLSKAGQSVPTAASFNAFFSKITPNMSMPNFTALFNKLIGKKTEGKAQQKQSTNIFEQHFDEGGSVDASKPQSLSAVTPVETVGEGKSPVRKQSVREQSSTGQVADMSQESTSFTGLQGQVKAKFSQLSDADVDKITQLVQVIKSENISQARDLFKNDKYKELRSQLYEGDLPGKVTIADLLQLSSGKSTPSAQQSFFGGLSRQLPGEVPLVAAKQQTALAQERPLEFKTLQEYTKAQAKAEDAAELKALQPINRQVNELLNLQWQGVEEKYKQERQDLGQDIVPERVDLLKEQVKNKIYTELIAKNQSKIEEAKAQAVKEFQAKAVKPKPADGKFKLTDSKTLGPVQTESSVRAQAENKMKASLIESMVNKEFTSKFESAWVQDYALDYEMKNHAQASPAVISAAKDKYKKELALQMYSKLTPENKVSIKQAGENAVDAWNSQKQQDMTQVQAGSSGKGELKGLSGVAPAVLAQPSIPE